jgi:hypothetical protein
MNEESEESFTERDEDSRKEQCYVGSSRLRANACYSTV